jgi:hypothetical protein
LKPGPQSASLWQTGVGQVQKAKSQQMQLLSFMTLQIAAGQPSGSGQTGAPGSQKSKLGPQNVGEHCGEPCA